jgi:hypothetical protein
MGQQVEIVRPANGAAGLSPPVTSPNGSEPDNAASLRRLLQISNLTPAQALFLGHEILSALKSLPANGLSLDGVRVSGEGTVCLCGLDRSAPTEPEHAGLADVLHVLAAAVRGIAPSNGAAAALDAAADRAASAEADLDRVAAAMDSAERPPDSTRAEIGTLVSLATGSERPRPSARRPLIKPRSARPSPRDKREMPVTWFRPLWRSVAALAVLAGAVLLEFSLLHDRLSNDVRLLLDTVKPPSQAATPTGPPGIAPGPVPVPAPGAAGAVNGVDLRALQPCSAGTTCSVRVLMHLQAQPQPVTVRWAFQLADRCTGAQSTVPGGAVSVASRQTDVSVVAAVPLPVTRALAVIAVTGAPASAASPPLLVPSGRGVSC